MSREKSISRTESNHPRVSEAAKPADSFPVVRQWLRRPPEPATQWHREGLDRVSHFLSHPHRYYYLTSESYCQVFYCRKFSSSLIAALISL